MDVFEQRIKLIEYRLRYLADCLSVQYDFQGITKELFTDEY